MKEKSILLVLVVFLLSSCTFAPPLEVIASPYSDTPWEEVTGREIWYKAYWFDGREVHTEYLDRGVWSIKAKVYPDSLAAFVFIPLGTLSPIGGFWEMGDGGKVWLTPEEGSFAEMIIDTASLYPEVTGTLRISRLKEVVPDLGAIDKESFIISLLEGSLDSKEIKLSKKYKVPLDGVMKGKWVSLYSHTQTIVISNAYDTGTVSLFPGVYHYLNLERNLMLTITLESDGRYWTRLSPPPSW